MAARKKNGTTGKPQYVKVQASRRKGGGESSAFARRSVVLVLFVAVLCSLFVGLFLGFRWLGHQLFCENPSFEIQHLVISSDGRLTESLIREYTARERDGIPPLCEGQNLFARPLDEIEKTLLESPLIESVYLERKLPNTLIVQVKERSGVARIMGGQNTKLPFVTDRSGYILSYKLKDKDLPLIKGLEEELLLGEKAKDPDVAIALEIIMLCESGNDLRRFVKIDNMDVKYDDFIDMRINGETRVRMPRFSLEKKLRRLATTIEIARSKGQRCREIDLTLDTLSVPVVYY